jgi:hypothetical protein
VFGVSLDLGHGFFGFGLEGMPVGGYEVEDGECSVGAGGLMMLDS